jgi:hypothetical protein|tara:strand:+ start:382 stop:786 length:405 start_codon:yes stop_codon:yes gene_type:complete
MQTFLPYKDFKKSFKCLDYRRLGKQRVESYQILNVLLERTSTKGWRNHPATKMWRGYENALKLYMNLCIDEWVARGYVNNMKREVILGEVKYPSWLGNNKFHVSHKSNLVRKFPEHYRKYFPNVGADLPYAWPI